MVTNVHTCEQIKLDQLIEMHYRSIVEFIYGISQSFFKINLPPLIIRSLITDDHSPRKELTAITY